MIIPTRALLSRQTDIEQHERWTLARYELAQFSAPIYAAHPKILTRQILHQEVALRRFILDYDDVWARLHVLRLQPPG